MASVRVVVRALSSDSARLGVAAAVAPALAAGALGRSVGFTVVAVLAGALLTLLGSALTLRAGSLGVAIVIATHGPPVATLAIAAAGLGAVGLSLVGVERVIRKLPSNAVSALLCAFAAAAVARLVLPVHAASAHSVVGDALSLALVLCCESAELDPARRGGGNAQLAAAAMALPLGATLRVRDDAAPLAAMIATAIVVALVLSPLRAPLVIVGVVVCAVYEVVRRARGLGAAGVLMALAIAALAVVVRPAVAVVGAVGLAGVLAMRR